MRKKGKEHTKSHKEERITQSNNQINHHVAELLSARNGDSLTGGDVVKTAVDAERSRRNREVAS